MSNSAPTVISTFSGPGGSSIGYERAGCDVRVALDYAPETFSDAIPDTYRANHPDTTFLEADARFTDGAELLDAAGLDRGDLDILDGSPPCSPFSSANSKREWGDHASKTLFDHYARLVAETQPRTFIAENVPSIAQGKTKGYFKQLCQRLRDPGGSSANSSDTDTGPTDNNGYHLRIQKIDPAYFGTPQYRPRLMFLGVRTDIADAAPGPLSPTAKPIPIAQAWSGVTNTEADLEHARKTLDSSANADAYTAIPHGKTLSDVIGRGWSHYRLKYSEPAPMFTHAVNVLPPNDNRLVTIPELKRITSLPDDYHLASDSYRQNWELCIRCLPPELTQTIATHYADAVL